MLTAPQLRAAWMTHMGLARPGGTDPVETLRDRGLLRTLGGASAYLGLLARQGQLDGAAFDAAVESGAVWIVPAARGCIYLVPREDVPVCLRWGWLTALRRHQRDVEKAGGSWQELEDVAGAALTALEQQELTTQKLRKALPEGAVRSLGPAGKRVGMSSLLPLSLRLLESQGRIRRVPATGRLDKESYAWRVLRESPFDGGDTPQDLEGLVVSLVRRVLEQGGPASRRELADWSGGSQTHIKKALAALGVVQLEVEGADPKDPYVCLPEHEAGLGDCETAPWALLPFMDPYTDYRNRMAWLAEERHHHHELNVGGASTKPISAMKTTWQRTVLRDGCLAGLWEFDPEGDRVVVGLYEDPGAGAAELEARAEAIQRWLVGDLGHGRCFSLDTPKSMGKRLARVRELPHVLG